MFENFNTKGQQTKALKKILGGGFSVKTNAACTVVKGDLAEAKELLAGYSMFFGFSESADRLFVWAH
jgi:hypothetical protein